MQNVHTRGNIHGNLPLFGQIAGFLPYLDKARGICYIFHRFRQEAGCAGRSLFSPFVRSICSICALRMCAARRAGSGPAILFFTDATKGSAFGLQAGQAPFYLAKGGSFFMKTNPRSTTRSLVLAALFLALAFVLPMVTGHVPQVGNMLCPMHFPILLCGFVLGGPWGLAVGFIAPLVRSVLFGMPPMFPIAISMAFELAAYGLVSGVLWRRVKHTVPMMYASLVTAMVAGRLVWGAVRFVLAGLTGSSFPFSAFLSGALLTAVPGIIAQLVLIPLILVALQKAKVID